MEHAGSTPVGSRAGCADFSDLTLTSLLQRANELWPGNVAAVIGGRRVTYAQLGHEVERLARGLVALGVRSGDRVCVLVPNSVDSVTTLFAISRVGAIPVQVNVRYLASELAFVLGDCDPSLILTSDETSAYRDLAALLQEAIPVLADAQDPFALSVPSLPSLRAVVLLGSSRAAGLVAEAQMWDRSAASAVDLPAPSGSVDDTAAIVYTSGTTSAPRGAILSHHALVGHWALSGCQFELTSADRFWNPCPIFHIAGVGPLIWCVAHGATFVADTYFRADRALAQIVAEKATVLYPTYPPIMRDLMNDCTFAGADLSLVRAFNNVAPPEELRASQAAIPHAAQFTVYGGTEGGCVTMVHIRDDYETRMTTNGVPVGDVQLRIVDPDTGRPAAPGGSGEIQYRGANAIDGYWGDPVKTSQTIDAEGWLHTGDRGSLDGENLRYLGRLKEMLKVGGENVAPAEVEQVLAAHPAVKLSQVIGIPDPRLVEVVAAFVELIPGYRVDEDELIEYCRQRMAKYKVPRTVRLVTEWPMSVTKIQKNKLRDMLLAELATTTPT